MTLEAGRTREFRSRSCIACAAKGMPGFAPCRAGDAGGAFLQCSVLPHVEA